MYMLGVLERRARCAFAHRIVRVSTVRCARRLRVRSRTPRVVAGAAAAAPPPAAFARAVPCANQAVWRQNLRPHKKSCVLLPRAAARAAVHAP